MGAAFLSPFSNRRKLIMKKFALSALIAFAATSALAQTTTVHEEYYVVRDPATKNCRIVDQKPTLRPPLSTTEFSKLGPKQKPA